MSAVSLPQEFFPRAAARPILGVSAAMQEVFRLIERVGPTEASVLLTGESGSGKELAAQSIHDRSLRRGGPFLAINCGAIPSGLIEAELFGYEKGSFTGAVRGHAGVFERADGGTLLLDEITEMPLDMQTRLLRVIETRKFYRVGASLELSTDVRVIAASNRCPLQAVQSGQLREDLLYRLAVFPIELPPLRDRAEDVPLLAQHFLSAICEREGTTKTFTQPAVQRLQAYRWPGNVRELRNVVQRAYVMAAGNSINEEWLPDDPHGPNSAYASSLSPSRGGSATASTAPVPAPSASGPTITIPIGTSMADAERQLILATLEHFNQQKERTAAALGVSLKTLYNRLKEYAADKVDATPE